MLTSQETASSTSDYCYQKACWSVTDHSNSGSEAQMSCLSSPSLKALEMLEDVLEDVKAHRPHSMNGYSPASNIVTKLLKTTYSFVALCTGASCTPTSVQFAHHFTEKRVSWQRLCTMFSLRKVCRHH